MTSSKLLENAVYEISKLPGIGKRTALRLALHLLRQPQENTKQLTEALQNFRDKIIFCKKCYNISDMPICKICANLLREKSIICIVEDIRDVMAIENTDKFKGYYHVLGGVISPIEGVGPNDLTIEPLIKKIATTDIKEVVFAFSSTIESDTTQFYIHKQLKKYNVLISTIAKGIAIGDEIEYTDEITLGRSILKEYRLKILFLWNKCFIFL